MNASHRPWPPPARAWTMAQRWHDALFLHWAVDPAAVRPLVPAGLDLDVRDGRAWIGVVPFRMTGIRARWLPALPGLRAFPELNVRTYVTAEDKPGVWFFSLDAHHRIAVAAARALFHLNYRYARMTVRDDGEWIRYESRGPGSFAGHYRPAGPVYAARAGDLDHWLTERYCLYAAKGERLYRGEILHAPWPLQPAEAEIEANTVAPLPLPETAPLAHFARSIDVRIWPLERVFKT